MTFATRKHKSIIHTSSGKIELPNNIYIKRHSTIPARIFVLAFFIASLLAIYALANSGLQIHFSTFTMPDIWGGLGI